MPLLGQGRPALRQKEAMPGTGVDGHGGRGDVSVVAGTGFEPVTFRL